MYPPALCRRIVRGLRLQLESDAKDVSGPVGPVHYVGIGGHEADPDGDPSHTVAVPRGVSRMSPMSSAHDTWLSSVCDCGHLAILNAEEPDLQDRCQDGVGSKEPGY